MTHPLKAAFASLLVIPAILSSCSGPKAPAPGTPGGPPLIKDYPVITISRQHATMNLDYPATLEGQQTVEIRPRVDGIIEHIYVDEGSVVKKGQPLFRLDQAKYLQNIRSLQANIQVAQAEVNAAEMEVNKVKPLVEKEIISKYTLQTAQYTLQARQAALAQAKAALANAKTDLSYTIITSPANGIIGTIPFKIGALVSSNMQTPLTTVADTKDVYAYFSLNEKQLMELSGVGAGKSIQQKITTAPAVFLLLPDGTQYTSSGKIQTASGIIDTETGSSRLRASFPNAQGLLRSGGTGSVRIPVNIDTAILVPQKATYEIQGKRFVYVVAEADSNKVRAVEISVNPITSGNSFIVQGGLKPGEKIVVEGAASLIEGAKIIPRTVNADSVFKSRPKL